MKTSLFGILVLIVSTTQAQKNTVFFELGGNGGLTSLNYERQLTQNSGLSLRVGLGLSFFEFEKEEPEPDFASGCALCGIDIPAPEIDFSIPLSLQYLFDLNKSNYLETGFGYTWQWAEKYEFGAKEDKKSIHIFFASLGFRRHFGKDQNWMWKVNFTPLIGASGEEVYKGSEPTIWGGFSIGKRF